MSVPNSNISKYVAFSRDGAPGLTVRRRSNECHRQLNHGRSKTLPRFELPVPYWSRRSQITGTMGFEPTTVGLEVRRSFRTELRALESDSTTERYKRLGFPIAIDRLLEAMVDRESVPDAIRCVVRNGTPPLKRQPPSMPVSLAVRTRPPDRNCYHRVHRPETGTWTDSGRISHSDSSGVGIEPFGRAAFQPTSRTVNRASWTKLGIPKAG